MQRLADVVVAGSPRLVGLIGIAAVLFLTVPAVASEPAEASSPVVASGPGVASAPVVASGEAQEPVIRVEQDWRLVLTEPDDAVLAPQLHTVMSPFGNLNSLYAQVTWNYAELPDFEEGGLQIQAWEGEDCSFHRSFNGQGLSGIAETVRWTQVMETNGNTLSCKIVNGQSTTWGSFGGQSMGVNGSAAVPNLNQYDTGVSVGNSLVTYGANRVRLLVITEVRRYGEDGLLSVESNPRVIFRGE